MVGQSLPRVLLVDGLQHYQQLAGTQGPEEGEPGGGPGPTFGYFAGICSPPLGIYYSCIRCPSGCGGKNRYPPHGSVQAVYTGEGQTADAFIERLTADFAGAVAVEVATSDWEEQRSVFMHGATRLSARELALRLRDEREIMQDAYTRVNKDRRRRLDDHLSPELRERLESMRRQKKP
jgi:hypothetical protein